MVPSETTSAKACELHGLHKLFFLTRKMAKEAMQNVIGGKKLRFSFSGYSFKGRELSPI